MQKNHFVCLACGFIVEGDEPPDKFPICAAPKGAYYARHLVPSAPPLKTFQESNKGKPAPKQKKNHWVCLACGHIHADDSLPEQCPICKTPKSALPRQYY